jgi:predicted methyltransferase
MRQLKILAAALALSVSTASVAAAPKPPTISSAVAAQDRTADNVQLDAGRKPVAVLSFLGLRPGMQVLDLFGFPIPFSSLF